MNPQVACPENDHKKPQITKQTAFPFSYLASFFHGSNWHKSQAAQRVGRARPREDFNLLTALALLYSQRCYLSVMDGTDVWHRSTSS